MTSKPYDVAEGTEYAEYLGRLLGECRRLLDEGRLPDDGGVLAFLDDAELVLRQVRVDTAAAARRGDSHVQSVVTVSAEEFKRLNTMNDSLLNLLEILELRQALTLNRTPAVARVAEALRQASFGDEP